MPLGFGRGLGLALAIGLPATATLLWWLNASRSPEPPAREPPRAAGASTRRLILATLAAAAALFAVVALFGRGLLFGVPVVAIAVLMWLRLRFSGRALRYALGLALVAGVAGLGVGHITYIPLTAWAALQVPLVWLSLLAGWALLEHTGLLAAGVGHSLYLSVGPWAAAKGFARGFVLAIPWALIGIVMGTANNDRWSTAWWRPLAALQPGIAEEAWARLFLITLLFMVLRRAAGRARAALTAAVIVGVYWFAYLHTIDTPGSMSRIVSMLLIGTLFNLPLAYVWLRRGLETSIGFHVCMDFLRFGAAVLLNAGMLAH
jgi:hypothetical protein